MLKRSGEILEWGCKWNSAAFDIYGRLSACEGKFSRFAYKLATFLEPYALDCNRTVDWGKMKEIILAETMNTIMQTEGADKILPCNVVKQYLDEALIEKYPNNYLGLFLVEAFINRPR